MSCRSRAEAVVAYLVKKQIARSRLTARGLGEEKPIADNGTTEGPEPAGGIHDHERRGAPVRIPEASSCMNELGSAQL